MGFDVTWPLDAGIEPKFDHVWENMSELDLETLEDDDPDGIYYGRRVIWYREGGHYVIRVKAHLVQAMSGNQWDWNHFMGLYETIATGDRPLLETPAARVHTVSKADVAYHEEILETQGEDELEQYLEEAGIQASYTRADIGQYRAQLVDGNHRAFSAILAGESYIFVTVGPNYRDDIDPDDWE